MKEKIKPALPWIIVVLLGVVITGLNYLITYQFDLGISRSILSLWAAGAIPSTELLQFSVRLAIEQFGGGEFTAVEYFTSGAISAAGLLLLMIIAPYLFIKGYQKIETTGSEYRPVSWYIGATILVIGMTLSLSHLTSGFFANVHNNRLIEASRSQDQLRGQLMDLAFDAAGVMILPHEYGGGAGSFNNLPAENGGTRSITLQDLPSYTDGGRFEFLIDGEISDSSFTVTGYIKEGPDLSPSEAELNLSERRFNVDITPYEEQLFRFTGWSASAK